MILTLINKTASPKSYLGWYVTVGASTSASVPREFNTLLMGDSTFIGDLMQKNVAVSNDTFNEFSGDQAMELVKIFNAFAAIPLATFPIYYALPVNIRQSAGTASGSVVWAMRNDSASPKLVTIERIQLIMSFDAGTPLVRSLQRYGLRRFNTAAPSGGTALTPVEMSSTITSTSVTDARFLDTGLTKGSMVLEDPFAIIGCPASDGSVSRYERKDIPIKLGAGEGLAIVLEAAAVQGQGLTGEIGWAER